MNKRFVKKIEELKNPSSLEKSLEEEINNIQKQYLTLTDEEKKLQEEIADRENGLKELDERINARTATSEEYRSRDAAEAELNNKMRVQVELRDRLNGMAEQMQEKRTQITEKENERNEILRKVTAVSELQDELEREAMELEGDLDNLQNKSALLNDEKENLSNENRSLTNENKKLDRRIEKLNKDKATEEAKKNELDAKEAELDALVLDLKAGVIKKLEQKMEKIAKAREDIRTKMKAAKTDEEKEALDKELQVNLKEKEENDDLYIAVNGKNDIDLLYMPGIDKILTPKLKTVSKNIIQETENIKKERTENTDKLHDIVKEQNAIEIRKGDISLRKEVIAYRKQEIKDEEKTIKPQYSEIKNKYNSLRNRAAKCDLVMARFIGGKADEGIMPELRNFENRDFTCAERLSERKGNAEIVLPKVQLAEKAEEPVAEQQVEQKLEQEDSLNNEELENKENAQPEETQDGELTQEDKDKILDSAYNEEDREWLADLLPYLTKIDENIYEDDRGIQYEYDKDNNTFEEIVNEESEQEQNKDEDKDISDEDFNAIDKKVAAMADRTKKQAAAEQRRNLGKQEEPAFNTFMSGLQNDLKNMDEDDYDYQGKQGDDFDYNDVEDEYDDQKQDKNKQQEQNNMPAVVKKPGIFKGIINWFKEKFSKNKVKEQPAYENKEDDKTQIVNQNSNKENTVQKGDSALQYIDIDNEEELLNWEKPSKRVYYSERYINKMKAEKEAQKADDDKQQSDGVMTTTGKRNIQDLANDAKVKDAQPEDKTEPATDNANPVDDNSQKADDYKPGIDLLSLDDEEFEKLLKETSKYGLESAQSTIQEDRAEAERIKQEKAAERARKAEARRLATIKKAEEEAAEKARQEEEAKAEKARQEEEARIAEQNAIKEAEEQKRKAVLEKREELSKAALFREGQKFGIDYANNSAKTRKKLDAEAKRRLSDKGLDDIEK